MDGRVVHEWALAYSQIWDESAAVDKPRPDPFIYIEKAHVIPNGDLLALYTAIGNTPWGYGLVKMNTDSKVIWKYVAPATHYIDLVELGRVLRRERRCEHTDL